MLKRMTYRCTLFVDDVARFNGTYADAATAVREILVHAREHTGGKFPLDDFVSHIESGPSVHTLNISPGWPYVYAVITRV